VGYCGSVGDLGDDWPPVIGGEIMDHILYCVISAAIGFVVGTIGIRKGWF